MDALRIVNSMAPNALATYRRLAGYLEDTLGLPAEVLDGEPWPDLEARLWAGQAELGFVCGLTYVRKVDDGAPIELLAAPVMAHPRYGDRPVYLSDVLVRKDSPFRTMADLRGAAWAYNEPGSHSGYNTMRCRLAGAGGACRYFGRVVEAGSHQAALAMLAEGTVDVSAVDTIVLAAAIRQQPELADRFRVLETLGPSPIPPLVVHRDVPAELKRALADALMAMHRDVRGRAVLASAGIARFEVVDDAFYDPIRAMDRAAAWPATQPDDQAA